MIDGGRGAGEGAPPDVPHWDDEYVDRVSDRLLSNYDLEKDYRVRGEVFPLYGQLSMTSHKQFLHPALSYARHDSAEHLFVRRVGSVTVAELERLVALAHDLADEWIVADEEHFGTEFTFALVVPAIPDEVRAFVADFSDRTLLKYGYYGHYEVNLVVVAPGREAHVASEGADVWRAFAPWADTDGEQPGLIDRLLGVLGR
ncbi:hypothetical protein BRC90_03795 [Halobacteriales archaeon QS_4_69_34]|nr:MAG: hypothetical protein BRC90_03795 [Halobacteriales archaeon QS_4_69_34]